MVDEAKGQNLSKVAFVLAKIMNTVEIITDEFGIRIKDLGEKSFMMDREDLSIIVNENTVFDIISGSKKNLLKPVSFGSAASLVHKT